MVVIDLFLLKELNCNDLALQYSLYYYPNHNYEHAMLCFTPFSDDIKYDATNTVAHIKQII